MQLHVDISSFIDNNWSVARAYADSGLPELYAALTMPGPPVARIS